MKKLLLITSLFTPLFTPFKVLAAETINITEPTKGYKDLGKFVTNALTVAFGIALLVVLAMLIWGAFEWIVSGGDKDAVGKARGRIINALIGLAVLAVAFALAKVGGQFLGFTNLSTITIPGPSD